jgi:hypothetical protein
MVMVENVTKRFGSKTVAGNVSFKIHKAKLFCLLGPNDPFASITKKQVPGFIRKEHCLRCNVDSEFCYFVVVLNNSLWHKNKFIHVSFLDLLSNAVFFSGLMTFLSNFVKTKRVAGRIELVIVATVGLVQWYHVSGCHNAFVDSDDDKPKSIMVGSSSYGNSTLEGNYF